MPLANTFSAETAATPGAANGYLVPDCFRNSPGLVALQSTRNGGVSKGSYFSLNLGKNTGDVPDLVLNNMQLLCNQLSINPERMVSSEQVHATRILCAEKPGHYQGYDAFITDQQNLFLCVFTADCYPVLIYDPRHRASGAAHAGWKGTAGMIVKKTMQAMQRRFDTNPEECLAFIGAGISVEAYEVGHNVASAFPPDCTRRLHHSLENEKYQLDLRMANYRQLLDAGVPASSIECSSYCTFRDNNLFFSFRRDQGVTGRMVSLIGVASS
ncbi:MAG: peptidoglycan editing factor PgeF [Chlorobium sp.]